MPSLSVIPTGHRLARVAASVVLAATCGLTSCIAWPDVLERARTQDDSNDEPPPTDQVPEGGGAVPIDDGSAWIQLKSGEWLRGELVRIRDDVVYFDSDELDEQEFDLEDVLQIRSPRAELVVTDDNRVFGGELVIDGDKVWIIGSRTVQITRKELQSALSVTKDSATRWFVDMTLGSTVRSGNSDQADLNAGLSVLRETARTRAEFDYIGAVSTVKSTEITNNHRVDITYDVFLTKRLFITVPGVSLFSDRIQNIQLRSAVFAAVGYEIVDTKKHSMSLSLGPAYQVTRQTTVAEGLDPTTSTYAFQSSVKYEWEVTKDIDFTFDYSLTAPRPDRENYNHSMLASFEFEITKKLDIDFKFIWDRVNRPVAGSGDVLPVKDDYRSMIGLTYSF